MSMPSAKIILDSVSPEGIRLTTVHMRYWRAIHAELMTHRVFSRNARSSRAVPISRMIEEVRTDPFIPQHWGKNQKGMQATEECNEPVSIYSPHIGRFELDRRESWLWARDQAVDAAVGFADAGYHKQLVNRLLEPFMWIDTLVTSTDWANFYHLRLHSDAEPHMIDLARATRAAMDDSVPKRLQPGEWHLPYVTQVDWLDLCGGHGGFPKDDAIDWLRKISVARCARISYTPFDGRADFQAELERHDKLVVSDPLHASPAEHQATPDILRYDGFDDVWDEPNEHGNFRGWRQYRKMLPNECVND
jgi:hypothetical protein